MQKLWLIHISQQLKFYRPWIETLDSIGWESIELTLFRMDNALVQNPPIQERNMRNNSKQSSYSLRNGIWTNTCIPFTARRVLHD